MQHIAEILIDFNYRKKKAKWCIDQCLTFSWEHYTRISL